MSFAAHRSSRYQRNVCRHAGSIQGVAYGVVIAAINNQNDPREQLGKVGFYQLLGDHLSAHFAIELSNFGGYRLRLVGAQIIFAMGDLSLKIEYGLAPPPAQYDTVRDGVGDPVVDADGRFVTDPASPRLTAYQEDGLIWDVGVLWRPSSRTSVSGYYGQRYGSDTFGANLTYQPRDNFAVNVAVYDQVSGFGNLLNDNLGLLGTDFTSSRNPLSGELNGCAFGQTSSLCFNDVLQSASSSAFRARGVNGQLAYRHGNWNTALAVGYSRRRFFASQLGAIPATDGLVDENYYANFTIGTKLDAVSSFDANVYANLLDSGVPGSAKVLGLGANAAYYRQILPGLQGTAAVGLDSFKQDGFDSELTASALLGLRYDF